MDTGTWNLTCIFGFFTVAAALFSVLQYFNKRGRSKKLVLYRSIILGLVSTLAVYALGFLFWVNPPNSPVALSPKFRSSPVDGLSENDINEAARKYDFYLSMDSYANSVGRSTNRPASNPSGKGFKNKFVLYNDGQVVIDYAAGLMWERDGTTLPLSYADAIEHVRQMNDSRFAGYSDWRLPTLEEALSLVEVKKNGFTHIDPIFGAMRLVIWTSDQKDENQAWTAFFCRPECQPMPKKEDKIAWARAVR